MMMMMMIFVHGLDFCVPFHMPGRGKVFADIEVLYSQLARLKPSSNIYICIKA